MPKGIKKNFKTFQIIQKSFIQSKTENFLKMPIHSPGTNHNRHQFYFTGYLILLNFDKKQFAKIALTNKLYYHFSWSFFSYLMRSHGHLFQFLTRV